jgi:hypothetical protein
MATVSPDLMRAIFEARDNKHDEAHAAILALWQALVAELVASGDVSPEKLGDRMDYAFDGITPEPHGEAARTLVAHASDWVRSLDSGKVAPPPKRWFAPKLKFDAGD